MRIHTRGKLLICAHMPLTQNHYYTGARPGWQMPPPGHQQPRPYMQVNAPNQQPNPSTGGSALLAQLNQPPSMPTGNVNVNQFGQSK